MSGEAVHGKQSAAVELERLLRDERDKSVDSIERILHYFAIAYRRPPLGATTQLSTAEEATRASEGKQERTKASAPRATRTAERIGENAVSKGMDQKKQDKKKPAKTLEEKRAAKKAKKAARGFIQRP